MCFCYQFSDERDSRAHPGAGLGRGGLTPLSVSCSSSSLLGPPSFLGCASHLHTFVSSRGGLQLIKAFSYNLPESCCSQPLPAAEREHCQAQEKKKERMKRKEKGEGKKAEGRGERQHVLQSKTKAEGWYKGIHCVCLCLVFDSPLEAGTVLC